MGARKVCPACAERYPTEVLFCPADGSPLANGPDDATGPPLEGVVAAGVRLGALVGIGSVARVYRGRQQGVDRDVAVKVLRRDRMNDPAAAARFEREARVTGRLAHPGLVAIHSVGDLDSGEPFIVMEYLDGLTLRSVLAAAREPLDVVTTLHVVLQIADALGEAHAAGVVHRDVKPDNVMLVRRGDDPSFVKLLDFGVARAQGIDDSALTRDGSVLGTADYLAPEAGRGRPATPAADVYSLATVAFECLVGSRPHVGTGPVDVLVKKTTRDATPVGQATRGNVPAPIAAWVDKNLARDPAHRHGDARTAGRALLEAAAKAGLDARDIGAPATLFGGSATTRALTLDSEMRARLGHPLADDGLKPGRGGAVGAAVLVASLLSGPARAQDLPTGTRPVEEPTETFGMAEFGVGLLTLPTAEVCVERSSAGCGKGDRSLVVSGWPLFRRGPWAIGAGVTLALTPSTDAPRNDPPDLPRDHSRTYLTVEITGRYYVPFTEALDGWVGVTGGMVVLNDTFQTEKGLTEQALVGPRGVTILTEGGTLGVGAGLAWSLSPSWLIGGGARVSNWFLPDQPETNALGDEASLQGNVITVELGASIAYRSRLVF